MNHIGVAKLAIEKRPVGQLGCEGPHVFHSTKPEERPRQLRIDWHQPRVNVWIVSPPFEQSVRLNRLSSEDVHGRRHERDLEPLGRLRLLHGAHLCKPCAGRGSQFVRFRYSQLSWEPSWRVRTRTPVLDHNSSVFVNVQKIAET